MRILLVEDDMMLGDGMVDALRSSGYTVDWLQQGLPALSALKSEEFAAQAAPGGADAAGAHPHRP